MSAYNIGWIWDQDVTATQKLILFALNEHTNMGHGDWRIWPALGRICRMTGLCERTVRANIRELAESGIITVCEQRDTVGRQLTNLYYLSAPFPRVEGALNAGGRGQQMPGEGALNAPEPSNINPLSKNKNNGDEYAADFLLFWRAWPDGFGSKGGKAEAFKEWRKAKSLPPPNDLISIAQGQADEKAAMKAAGKFAENFKHVCRWLKGREWENDAPTLKAVSGEVYR